MESDDYESDEDIQEKLLEIIKKQNPSAVPFVDVIDETESCTSFSNEKYFNDEVDDLLEEQIVSNTLKKYKKINKSLLQYKNPKLEKIDQHIRPNLEVSQSYIDSDDNSTDSLIGTLIDELPVTNNSNDIKTDRVKYLRQIANDLSFNIILQTNLNALESFLKKELKENRTKQNEVKDELNSKQSRSTEDKKSKLKQKVCNYSAFGRPYFKDHEKFVCPNNADCKKMQSLNHIISINFFPSKTWTHREILQLQEGVRKMLKEDIINEFISKENKLLDRIKNEKTNKGLEENLASIVKMKNSIEKDSSLNQLFQYCEPDREFDWLRISSVDCTMHNTIECQRMWHMYAKPTINKSKFTLAENEVLTKLIINHGFQNWYLIAQIMKRSEYLVFLNYTRNIYKGYFKTGKWTLEEDKKLFSLVGKYKQGNYIPWPKISYLFGSRSKSQLALRWNQSINPDLKKGRFTKNEDKLILTYVRKYGQNFTKIANLLGFRTSVQIRERFLRKKSWSTQNVGRWSLEEDEYLMSLVKHYGERNWSSIAKHLMTRTRTQVRQRYNNILLFLKKHPSSSLENIHRSKNSQAKTIKRINQFSTAEKSDENALALKAQTNKKLDELIIDDDNCFEDVNNIDLPKGKRGRKKMIHRIPVDKELKEYFKEVFYNNKLKLRTQYIKPDVDQSANALFYLFHYFKTSINVNGKDFDANIKKLPYTLRKVVLNVANNKRDGISKVYDKNIKKSNLVFNSHHDHYNIEYSPIDPKETFISNLDFLLDESNGLKESTPTNYIVNSNIVHYIPYFLPPNIITMIGLRSIHLVKHKIVSFLTNGNKNNTLVLTSDSELMKRNKLKYFSGYFSADDENSENETIKNKVNNTSMVSKHVKNTSIDLHLNEDNNVNILLPDNPSLISNNSPSSAKTLNDSHNMQVNKKTSNVGCDASKNEAKIQSTNKESESTLNKELYSFDDGPLVVKLPKKSYSTNKVKHIYVNNKVKEVNKCKDTFTETIRLTKQEAIDLWKERLMAVFGWPIVLANQPPSLHNLKETQN